MKPFKTYLLCLFAVLLVTSCKNEQPKNDTEKSVVEEISIEKQKTQEKPQKGFEKTLGLQNIRFDVVSFTNGSGSKLVIQPDGLEINNSQVVHDIEGKVVNAEIEDLNSDGFPEILVYTTSAGSGSYGNVIGYSVNNGKSMSQISFPDIMQNDEASSGYMGHDEFAIVETSLVRRFPIYKDGDTNSNPTGGTRQLKYKLKDGEASRIFVLEKIVEY